MIIINTCSVKHSTENKIVRRFRDIKERYKDKILVGTGCLVEHDKNIIVGKVKDVSLFSINNLDEFLGNIDDLFKGKKIELVGKRKYDKNKKMYDTGYRGRGVIDIVQISSGCLGNCSYCATKFAKGGLLSFDYKYIVERIKNSNAKEFWLTAQDLSSYGMDKKNGVNLARLVKEILKLNKDFRLRLGMMNPHDLYSYMDEFLDVVKDRRVFKFFHIPIQSGSDKVLKDMNRKGNVKEFRDIVRRIRERYPESVVGTDIIVGYPTETEDDFKESIKLIKDVELDWVNVSKYSYRKGTKASKLKQLDSGTVKKRSIEMSKIVREIEEKRIRMWEDWEGSIIVDEIHKNELYGRNFSYRPIHVPFGFFDECDPLKFYGKYLKVKVLNIDGLKIIAKPIVR